jgi:hypothetical protein
MFHLDWACYHSWTVLSVEVRAVLTLHWAYIVTLE